MTRLCSFAPHEFYHLYNRGTEKRNIFTSNADRDRFLALLYLANQENPVDLKLQGRTLADIERAHAEPLVDIVAFCLMPNHFHLLVQERDESGISKFMQKVSTGYTMYFNKRHERTGALFQGRFKATHVADDRYLAYLVSYIHLNPIKLIEPTWKEAGIKDKKAAETYLETYRYSSYQDYLGVKRKENMLLALDKLPEYFPERGNFKSFVAEWLTYKPE